MRLISLAVGLASIFSIGILAQSPLAASRAKQSPGLKSTSRAVLVDVVVTDSSGKPVTGLTRDAFAVREQGQPQTISFFEEHGAASQVRAIETPKLPPNTFSNFSMFADPPAVNVILLDSMNTRMANQGYSHTQVIKFLESARPGTRTAIFTMGLSLKFIQGFNDDPTVLAAALNNRKNIEVENPMMLKSQAEVDTQERVVRMGAAGLGHLFTEMDSFIEDDRKLITLGNLQRLAVFLRGFPGRKNIIWFSEKPPGVFNPGGSTGNPAIDDEIKKTLAMLGTARAALYPVDPRGVWAGGSAETLNGSTESMQEIYSDRFSAQFLAEQSGGRAFASTNGLAEVIDKITSDCRHFYTLSYSPDKEKMDGSFRKIHVTVAGGKYKLLYRSGYYAVDAESPSKSLAKRVQKLAGQQSEAVDPLASHMELGLPVSQQILYRVHIVPLLANENNPAEDEDEVQYAVDFEVDSQELRLQPNEDLKDMVEVSLVVYDRYGNIISREDHAPELKLDSEAVVKIHAKLSVPKGNYWLRTGIYDPGSNHVGSLEIPLSQVKALSVAN